uniref:Sushi domain-containing protein n=1 Tax=Cyprinus carpio carpio TaxID=630221 RepID=A0A8C1CWQ3_CYPCA
MAFMLLNLCAPALFLCLLKAGSIRAQCTQPDADLPIRQSFPDGSTVTFECVIGHRPVDLEASRSITCQGNQWTSLELSCSRKSCGNLANFFHGRYEVTGNLFGDTAKPVCDKGYMLAGNKTTRTCRDQGWGGRDPVCEPVKCSAPPAIENGQLEDEALESYDYLEAVSYRCNRGLNLIGQSTLHCSEDGTFKPDPPKCVDGCPVPTIPNAKRIDGRSPPYKLGNFIEYKCEDGYTMKGEAYIVCRANGWDPAPPRCIAPSTTPSTATTTTNAVTSTVHTTSKALKEKEDETKTNTKDSSMSIGAKVGIALGVVGLVVIGGVSLVYFMKRPS